MLITFIYENKRLNCHLFENYTHYTNTAVINIGIQVTRRNFLQKILLSNKR